ncbi:hypothetical protein [Persicitalea sp.]|uniref:hypothetical protein n=1 Tax=Persicitalea sp. TaxID=3100273 RepID=UPI00359458C0
MVKIGFICEGTTEKKIVGSEKFQKYLSKLGIEIVGEIRDAGGNGNLLPQNLPEFTKPLIDKGAEKIVVLTDLDEDACISFTKNRITTDENRTIIVAVRQVESWFLADRFTLSSLLKENFDFENPEDQANPYEVLRVLFNEKRGRGCGTKHILAKRMIKYGFSLENAAQHPNCPSATYFLNKLQQLATE